MVGGALLCTLSMSRTLRYSVYVGLILGVVALPVLYAHQRAEADIEVTVTPEAADWTYALGETAQFQVSVMREGTPVEGVTARYEVGPELMPPTREGTLDLSTGTALVEGGTMDTPGFLRLRVVVDVAGEELEAVGTAGFSPEAIQPVAVLPDDFMAYWENAIAEAREVPLEPEMTRLPDLSTDAVDVFHVSFQNQRRRSRIFGMLSVPTAPGTYPLVLQVPGAGVRPYSPNVGAAERGVIHLAMGIHGVPVNMEPSVYQHLYGGALANYWTFGIGDREAFYYYRVILGVIRAGDFLHSLPQADTTQYGVYGSSQGGMLALVAAALDDRITRLGAIHPAFSDHEGFLHGRAGGWPRLLSDWFPDNRNDQTIEMLRYYDVVNFARYVDVPGFYSWGFNDEVCPPTSMYAAYNSIDAPKDLWVVPETGHWTYDEQWQRILDFLIDGFAREE